MKKSIVLKNGVVGRLNMNKGKHALQYNTVHRFLQKRRFNTSFKKQNIFTHTLLSKNVFSVIDAKVLKTMAAVDVNLLTRFQLADKALLDTCIGNTLLKS